PEATATAEEWCTRWRRATPDGDVDVARLWDLDGWAETAADLRASMVSQLPALEAGEIAGLADGFVSSAAVLRHLQADPLLPRELLPKGWPGEDLRRCYDRFDGAYRAVLATWFRDET